MYEGVSKSFRAGRRERELQTVQLCATRCSCIAILWVSLVSFAAITLCVASERVFIVVSAYFIIDSVRKLLDILPFFPRIRVKRLKKPRHVPLRTVDNPAQIRSPPLCYREAEMGRISLTIWKFELTYPNLETKWPSKFRSTRNEPTQE
jgi:hypothetical protein